MGDFRGSLGGVYQDIGAVLGASDLTQVNSAGSINTKGSWTQLVASSVGSATEILVILQVAGTTVVDGLVDIGIGSLGNEKVILPNLLVSKNTGYFNYLYRFPFSIKEGTRVSARCQTNVSSTSAYMMAHLVSRSFYGSILGLTTAYGVATADSGGTLVDAGGTANTKGSWTQITSSTTSPIRQLTIALGNAGLTSRTGTQGSFDVAVGSAGNEKAILSDVPLIVSGSAVFINCPVFGPFFVNIPTGTRISVRLRMGVSTVGSRELDFILYGIY